MDLLRPQSKGLSISTSAEDGIFIPSLFQQQVVNEDMLKGCLRDSFENR